MSMIQGILISGTTAFFVAVFTSMATFFVTRYMPRITDHLEKKIKKVTNDSVVGKK